MKMVGQRNFSGLPVYKMGLMAVKATRFEKMYFR
jgi:hypothetical protein